MSASDSTVERGIGNVFADLDHPEADTHLLEADLVSRIDTIIRQRGITRTEAARLLGLTQPDVSRLLRGDFREYSLERLFRLHDRARPRHRHRHPPARARPPAGSCASRQARSVDATLALSAERAPTE